MKEREMNFDGNTPQNRESELGECQGKSLGSRFAKRKVTDLKDSGIPWIGEIPKDWEIKPLKFLSNIIMGQSPNGDEIKTEGEIPFMQGNADFGLIHPSPSTYCDSCNKHSRIGDILMSVRAPVGEMNMSDKIYGIGRGLCSIKPINIFPKFLWQYLLKSKKDFSVFSNGSTFDAITVSTLNNFPICFPNLIEQKAIAEFLDRKCGEIDELVALQDKMIEELKAYKQSIITETVTKGLNPNVPLKDSGIEWIGEIPQHWDRCRIKDIVNLQSGKNLTTEEISEEGDYPVYGGNGIRGYYHKYNNEGEFILIGRQGALCGNINYAYGKFWPTEHAVVCYPKVSFSLIWLGELLRSMNLGQYSLSSAQPGLAVERIKNLSIPLPPISEQQEIADFLDKKCDEIDSLIELKQQKIEELKDYKKSIIYEYVTGKISVI